MTREIKQIAPEPPTHWGPRVRIAPARAGLLVRHAPDGAWIGRAPRIPDEGADVSWSAWWLRRLNAGDIVILPPDAGDTQEG